MADGKLELVEGSGEDPVSMVQQIVKSVTQEGGEILGVVVFAKNDRTDELHTFIGSSSWPHDVARWPRLLEALRHTVEEASEATEEEATAARASLRAVPKPEDVH